MHGTMNRYKLELKHLAPYLPYNIRLQILWTHHPEDGFYTYMDRLDTTDGVYAGYEWFSIGNEDCCIKPILRPLSDLTKEIEHNGEKFVPIELLSEKFRMQYELLGLQGTNDFKVVDYNKLLEWHFDIFSLIDKGLAIDINNSLKQLF